MLYLYRRSTLVFKILIGLLSFKLSLSANNSLLLENNHFRTDCNTSFELDKSLLKDRPMLIFQIAQKWHNLKDRRLSLEADKMAAELFPIYANKIADQWYHLGEIDTAFDFDKIYLQAWNSIGPHFSDKWHRRNQKFIALKYDNIAIRKCSSPFYISKIADKYYEDKNNQTAFEFDKIAANLNTSIADFLAEKWHARSYKDFALHFDLITLRNPFSANQLVAIADRYYLYEDKENALKFDHGAIEKNPDLAHSIAIKWQEKKDQNVSLQFDRIYLKHFPAKAFKIADEWYERDKHVAFEFDKIGTEKNHLLMPEIANKWYDRNNTVFSLYFDNLFVKTLPNNASEIANKWDKRKAIDIALTFDKIVLKNSSSPTQLTDIADKYYNYGMQDIAFEFDQKAIELQSSLANEVADKWYDRGNVSTALHFDKLYVKNKPSLAIDVSYKWDKREEKNISQIFDKITLENSSSPVQLIEIADKYYDYNIQDIALEFDRKAVQLQPTLANGTADKWFNRNNMPLAIEFDKFYVQNAIDKTKLIIDNWHEENIIDMILEFSKIYSNLRFEIADAIAREYYKKHNRDIALKFAEKYLEIKFELPAVPPHAWLRDNQDLGSKYIEIYSQIRTDMGDFISTGIINAIIKVTWWGDDEYDKIYSELKQNLNAIKDSISTTSSSQRKNLYNAIYSKVRSQMASIIAKKWHEEDNTLIQNSKTYLHINSDMIDIIINEWKYNNFHNLILAMNQVFSELQVDIGNFILKKWHFSGTLNKFIEEFNRIYSNFPQTIAREITNKNQRPKAKNSELPNTSSYNNSTDLEIDHIYYKMTPYILDAISDIQKHLPSILKIKLQLEFDKICSETLFHIINSISNKWYKRSHQDISLDFDIMYLQIRPVDKHKIANKWIERGHPDILKEIDHIPTIEKFLIDPNARKIIKILKLLSPDSPIKQNFTERILKSLSPLEQAIVSNNLQEVKHLTSGLAVEYYGACTPTHEIALILASTLKEKDIYNYLCDIWNAPKNLKDLTTLKTILDWICFLEPSNFWNYLSNP